jgi:hypothetical protein
MNSWSWPYFKGIRNEIKNSQQFIKFYFAGMDTVRLVWQCTSGMDTHAVAWTGSFLLAWRYFVGMDKQTDVTQYCWHKHRLA